MRAEPRAVRVATTEGGLLPLHAAAKSEEGDASPQIVQRLVDAFPGGLQEATPTKSAIAGLVGAR